METNVKKQSNIAYGENFRTRQKLPGRKPADVPRIGRHPGNDKETPGKPTLQSIKDIHVT